jgi:DNA-binding ferritin-like protein
MSGAEFNKIHDLFSSISKSLIAIIDAQTSTLEHLEDDLLATIELLRKYGERVTSLEAIVFALEEKVTGIDRYHEHLVDRFEDHLREVTA